MKPKKYTEWEAVIETSTSIIKKLPIFFMAVLACWGLYSLDVYKKSYVNSAVRACSWWTTRISRTGEQAYEERPPELTGTTPSRNLTWTRGVGRVTGRKLSVEAQAERESRTKASLTSSRARSSIRSSAAAATPLTPSRKRSARRRTSG
jgi:hypothetical protein